MSSGGRVNAERCYFGSPAAQTRKGRAGRAASCLPANGRIAHTIAAQDGSWTTGTLKSGESTILKLDRAGTFRFARKEHPWAVAALTVTP